MMYDVSCIMFIHTFGVYVCMCDVCVYVCVMCVSVTKAIPSDTYNIASPTGADLRFILPTGLALFEEMYHDIELYNASSIRLTTCYV